MRYVLLCLGVCGGALGTIGARGTIGATSQLTSARSSTNWKRKGSTFISFVDYLAETLAWCKNTDLERHRGCLPLHCACTA